MADQDQPTQPQDDTNPNPGGLTPGMTPDGSTVGPQPTPAGVDENVSPPSEPVVDTGPKAGPNSEGQAPAADGVQTSSDLA